MFDLVKGAIHMRMVKQSGKQKFKMPYQSFSSNQACSPMLRFKNAGTIGCRQLPKDSTQKCNQQQSINVLNL
ncbi:unnamed protein product (macronuclear) [Paramecium tetraurelia]|uniref:Uncharacterized protein n=1 Tax=Paramecium tetraurelia TaxID=5888 RepID=A0DGM6_PARTE|nr:uncharacterized protein GSPATT00002322001 [Paramecium tetraurelia]CAK82193.1 unnamed protein product [Paramecium tetraurelia]|eukprot:XP_001449590.1 hypothetical protein (macronuclear) [Paramecium tetraurelia strain d4-2]